jgi:3-oxoacyl-[acyl-carrier protein] reductase
VLTNETVAIVTGASGAIGSAVARALSERGAAVVVHSNSRHEAGEALKSEIERAGGRAVHVNGDLTDASVAQRLVEAAQESFGHVDVLIGTAGANAGVGTFESLQPEDWMSAYQANFMTAVNAASAVVPVMRENGKGSIVLTSSIRGIPAYGREGIVAYSAAKAALVNLTATLAKDLGPSVLVNAVAPGFVWTPNYEAMTEELRSSFTDATIIKRFIQPAEIAETFLFLAETEIITGQTLIVDGGFSLKIA